MYLDPPYPNNGCNYLHNMREWAEHKELANRLHSVKCKWILSSYDIPEMYELYPGNYIIPVQSSSGMVTEKKGSKRVLNKEVLITNFPPDSVTVSNIEGSRQMRMLLDKDEKEYGK
jgi:site-specific DNA-adenine methylase